MATSSTTQRPKREIVGSFVVVGELVTSGFKIDLDEG